jgi:hypothetical protein
MTDVPHEEQNLVSAPIVEPHILQRITSTTFSTSITFGFSTEVPQEGQKRDILSK